MDELLFSTDMFMGLNPSLSDHEIAERVLAMFACHHTEGCSQSEIDSDVTPEPEILLAFVREVRQLHLFS